MRRAVLAASLLIVPACSGPVRRQTARQHRHRRTSFSPVPSRFACRRSRRSSCRKSAAQPPSGRHRARPPRRVYLGVCCEGVPEPSAHLVEYDPTTGTTTDRGGVTENLGRLGLGRPGGGAAEDSHEDRAGGGWLPVLRVDGRRWGERGRLQTADVRLAPVAGAGGRDGRVGTRRRRPRAVIAAAGGGRFVYFLAYFGTSCSGTNRPRVRCGGDGRFARRARQPEPRRRRARSCVRPTGDECQG